jgi:hypothetical protein
LIRASAINRVSARSLSTGRMFFGYKLSVT